MSSIYLLYILYIEYCIVLYKYYLSSNIMHRYNNNRLSKKIGYFVYAVRTDVSVTVLLVWLFGF